MDPGRLVVAMTVVPVKGPGDSDGARAAAGPGAITPVPSAGVTGPKPPRKTVTTEPAIAGLEQSFTVPSAFSANAAWPSAVVSTVAPPHADQPGNGLATASGERKIAGCRSTTPRVRVSDTGFAIWLLNTCICTVLAPAIS